MKKDELINCDYDNGYANVWIECECGHEFWWDTYKYGPDILCANCEREYRTYVKLELLEVK